MFFQKKKFVKTLGIIFTNLILPCDNDRSIILSIQENTEIGLTDNVDCFSNHDFGDRNAIWRSLLGN